jgi:nicotinate-nucleotide adenylyltransferase
LYVYPRISDGVLETTLDSHPKIQKVEAPIIQISATMIRNGIKEGKNIRPMLTKEVWNYIDEMNFYRK